MKKQKYPEFAERDSVKVTSHQWNQLANFFDKKGFKYGNYYEKAINGCWFVTRFSETANHYGYNSPECANQKALSLDEFCKKYAIPESFIKGFAKREVVKLTYEEYLKVEHYLVSQGYVTNVPLPEWPWSPEVYLITHFSNNKFEFGWNTCINKDTKTVNFTEFCFNNDIPLSTQQETLKEKTIKETNSLFKSIEGGDEVTNNCTGRIYKVAYRLEVGADSVYLINTATKSVEKHSSQSIDQNFKFHKFSEPLYTNSTPKKRNKNMIFKAISMILRSLLWGVKKSPAYIAGVATLPLMGMYISNVDTTVFPVSLYDEVKVQHTLTYPDTPSEELFTLTNGSEVLQIREAYNQYANELKGEPLKYHMGEFRNNRTGVEVDREIKDLILKFQDWREQKERFPDMPQPTISVWNPHINWAN